MNEEKESNVRSLPKEKIAAFSEQYGCSVDFAEGYVNGEIARRRGIPLSCYLRIGVDQYALGFRAGYFVRQNVRGEADRPNSKTNIKQNEVNVSASNVV
jgi:hypothetical protein